MTTRVTKPIHEPLSWIPNVDSEVPRWCKYQFFSCVNTIPKCIAQRLYPYLDIVRISNRFQLPPPPPPDKMAAIFQRTCSNVFSRMKMLEFGLKFHWRMNGDKPLCKPMLVTLPIHICVTWPQWVHMGFFGVKYNCSHKHKRLNPWADAVHWSHVHAAPHINGGW